MAGMEKAQNKTNYCFKQAADPAVHLLYIYDDVSAYGEFNWKTWSYTESETSAKYFRDQLAAIPEDHTIELHIRFGNRTIGERRYFDAQTAGNKLSKLVSIPAEVLHRENIEVLDIVIIDSQSGWIWDSFDFERDETVKEHNPAQYKIVQIQEKFDSTPPAVYLSLEKIVQLYADRRPDRE